MDDVRIIDKRRVFEDIFAIDEAIVEYRRHDGSWSGPLRQLSFERGDSAAVLLLDRGSGNLILVNQFRYPTCENGPGWITEIVAGGVGPDESPEEAIAREVKEETGYEAKGLESIATFYVSPGGTSERVFLYYGEIDVEAGPATEAEGLGIGDEDIKVVEMSSAALWESFRSGKLQDAKTIVALLWLRERGRG